MPATRLPKTWAHGRRDRAGNDPENTLWSIKIVVNFIRHVAFMVQEDADRS